MMQTTWRLKVRIKRFFGQFSHATRPKMIKLKCKMYSFKIIILHSAFLDIMYFFYSWAVETCRSGGHCMFHSVLHFVSCLNSTQL